MEAAIFFFFANMIDTPYIYKRASSSLSSSRARYVYVCVCVCNTYVCVYIYVRRERERSSFFDARIELNSLTKILSQPRPVLKKRRFRGAWLQSGRRFKATTFAKAMDGFEHVPLLK